MERSLIEEANSYVIIFCMNKVEKTPHILIVDDDPQICGLVQDYLSKHGYQVSTANNGVEMNEVLRLHAIDLVVLDVMLPGEDGLSLCKKLQNESELLIIMISALGEESDRIVGLEVGADIYLPKPFSPRELLASIKALLRRNIGEIKEKTHALTAIPNLYFLNWKVERNRQRLISPQGVTVPLTKGEYQLLLVFLDNPGRVLNRDQLLSITHNREAGPYDRTIDVQIGRLRKKIENNPKDPQIIKTVRNGGYQFDTKVTQEE